MFKISLNTIADYFTKKRQSIRLVQLETVRIETLKSGEEFLLVYFKNLSNEDLIVRSIHASPKTVQFCFLNNKWDTTELTESEIGQKSVKITPDSDYHLVLKGTIRRPEVIVKLDLQKRDGYVFEAVLKVSESLYSSNRL